MDALINLNDCREHMTITLNGKSHQVKIAGTVDEPFFCGKDVCVILGYRDSKDAMNTHVASKYKKSLSELSREVGGESPPTYHNVVRLGKMNYKPSYNEGLAVYISEPGLYSLILRSKTPIAKDFKETIEPQITSAKAIWKAKERTMDMFEFIEKRHPALHKDINQPWFQQVWLPLCFKQLEGREMQGGENEPQPVQILGCSDEHPRIDHTHIVVTDALFEFMGYSHGQGKPQKRFQELLVRNNISFIEVSFEEGRHNQFIEHEAKDVKPSNLERKRWIIMDNKSFRKAVLKLNTKRANEIIEYYMNLEDFAFDYGRYTMTKRQEKIEAQLALKEQSHKELQEQLTLKDKSEAELQEQLIQKEQDLEHERQAKEEAEANAAQAFEAKIKAERKAKRINSFMNKVTIKTHKTEWIYIATTKRYSKDRIFKIGSTERLSRRIGPYNTGRPDNDQYFMAWAKRCYNSKDMDQHIQKLLSDFKHKNNSELYVGIAFKDLTKIVDFIIDNYDKSIDHVMQFIQERYQESLEEDDEPVIPLDLKTMTYQIGEHTEIVDVETIETKELEDLLQGLLNMKLSQHHEEDGEVVLKRKDIVTELSTSLGLPYRQTWDNVKTFLDWKNSKTPVNHNGQEFLLLF